MRAFLGGVACVLVAVGAAPSVAQWTPDAAANTLVAGGAGIQAKVRLSPVAGGGSYVSWWQSEDAPVYWSLRLNRLMRDGARAWPADVVVANAAATTTLGATTVNGSFYDVNYDLKTDAQGNAVLVWTDFRAFGSRNVFAQRISPAGAPEWVAGGVALTNDATFKRDPRVVATSDGRYAAVWFASTSPPTLRMQVLSSAGAPMLVAGGQAIVTATTASRPPDRFEAVAGEGGSVIVAWIREFSTSSSATRWVAAQKFAFEPSGSSVGGVWNGGQPVTVSAQNVGVQTQAAPFATNYPRVALAPAPGPNGEAGGCVLAFFDARSGVQNVYAQRLTPAGVPMWAGDGVSVSTDASRSRIEPAITFDSAGDALWVFCREIDAGHGTQGVLVQRLDSSGARAFGDAGLLAAPMGAGLKFALRAAVSGGGAVVFWAQDAGTAPSVQTIAGARVGPSGALSWPGSIASVALTPSNKILVQHPLDTSPSGSVARDGFAVAFGYPTGAVVAWQDARSDQADVYAQQLNTCGTPGLLGLADIDGSGARAVDDIFFFLSAWFASDPVADANGDGVRDVSDIFAFLSAWFAGC